MAKRMMSMGHTSDFQIEWTFLLYALMTYMPINMGNSIFSQLSLSVNNRNPVFYFSIIITYLCARAGVLFNDDDEWMQPMKLIDDVQWKAKF